MNQDGTQTQDPPQEPTAQSPEPTPVPQESVTNSREKVNADLSAAHDAPTEVPPAAEAAAPESASIETSTAPLPETHETPSPPQQPVVPVATKPDGREYLPQALAKRREKKTKKLEQILEYAKVHGRITNDEVQKLIIVSDRTAQRYLKELEKTGKLKAVGRSGRYTHYLLI